MDGFSRWDMVLWFVAAYVALSCLLVAVNHRTAVKQRFRSVLRQLAARGPRG